MSRISLMILAIFFAIFAAMIWLSIGNSLADPDARWPMCFALALTLGALGAAAGALDPNRFSWGRRFLALIGGATCGLLAAFLSSMSKSGPSVGALVAALAIFFGFSLPLLMFALWGSSLGPLGRPNKKLAAASTSGLLLLRIRVVSSYMVAFAYITYAVYRALSYFGVLG
jgi:hypothetical protein